MWDVSGELRDEGGDLKPEGRGGGIQPLIFANGYRRKLVESVSEKAEKLKN